METFLNGIFQLINKNIIISQQFWIFQVKETLPWHAVGTGRVVFPGVPDALQCLLLADPAGNRSCGLGCRRRIGRGHKGVVQFRLIPGIVQRRQTIVHNDGLRLAGGLVLALGQESVDAEGLLGLALGGRQQGGCRQGASTVAQVIAGGLRGDVRRLDTHRRCTGGQHDRGYGKTWQGIGAQGGVGMWHVMWRRWWRRKSIHIEPGMWGRRRWSSSNWQWSYHQRHDWLAEVTAIRGGVILGIARSSWTQARSVGAVRGSGGGRRVGRTASGRRGTGGGLGSGRQSGVIAGLIVVLRRLDWGRGSRMGELVVQAIAVVLVNVAQQQLRRHRTGIIWR